MQSEAELLKRVTEESTKRKAENVELKARIAKLEQTAKENTKLKDRITKLEQKQTQIITNEQEASTRHFTTYRGPFCSTQSESSTEPETSITSLPQDIIHDDSAEILDFVETIYKERISKSHNNLTPPIQSKISTMSTPESLNLKTVKKLWDQNQNKSQDKIFQSYKEKGTENIAQVIANGIYSNHVTEISATARCQNSSTISLLDLVQLFDKATDAEHYAMKTNQEETLYWINYGKEFIIQYNDLIKNSNGKIGEKKAKGIIYDKILEHLNIICERRTQEMGLQLPEISLQIIDNIFNNEPNIKNHMTEISTTARHQNHITEIPGSKKLPENEVNEKTKKALPETEASTITIPSILLSHISEDEISEKVKSLLETEVNVPTTLSIPLTHISNSKNKINESKAKVSMPPTFRLEKVLLKTVVNVLANNNKNISPETKIPSTPQVSISPTSQPNNPVRTRANFHNKLLEQYSNLYEEYSSENIDYYGNHYAQYAKNIQHAIRLGLCNNDFKKRAVRKILADGKAECATGIKVKILVQYVEVLYLKLGDIVKNM
ncbi:hypothetical protein Glove_203g39 [Diversispora epigaea]|uniref:Uncharacterized protein n=1 Tax=Diversispora epigaea TaxID=1348612 RepID=A0A397IU16_9GLOM|nr:hypothetical protein Glove_203g39 [Diversispora epigaea]